MNMNEKNLLTFFPQQKEKRICSANAKQILFQQKTIESLLFLFKNLCFFPKEK